MSQVRSLNVCLNIFGLLYHKWEFKAIEMDSMYIELIRKYCLLYLIATQTYKPSPIQVIISCCTDNHFQCAFIEVNICHVLW